MTPEDKRLWKIWRINNREFKIYREYDALLDRDIGIYPDFKEHPQYTNEGRPFAASTDDGCSHGKPKSPENTREGDYSIYGDCGDCDFFYREAEPWDIIGICMCEKNRRR